MKGPIIFSKINYFFLALFMVSIMNLLFMHYQILFTVSLESGCFKSSPFDNLLACLIDVTILLFASMIITAGKLRPSLAITFAITLILSFCHIFYSRFFNIYLPISSFGQIKNLNDNVVIDSMLTGFKYSDLYYVLAISLFIWIYYISKKCNLKKNYIYTLSFSWIIVIALVTITHCMYFFHPMTFDRHLRQTLCSPKVYNSLWPNWVVFHKGLFRTMLIDNLYSWGEDHKLTEEQYEEIKNEYTDYSERSTTPTISDSIKNVILIIVESYLSASSDLIVDGKEITPNLNKLKRDSNVYYNGHVKPNVMVGESSDGQFLYMTGLLPLRSDITVSIVKHNTLPGLPKVLKNVHPNITSQMIIPTTPTMWEQKEMAEAYGVQSLLSKQDYKDEQNNGVDYDLLDAQIFNFASDRDKTLKPPFFSIILTMSMHHPYNEFIEHGFTIEDNNYPQNYLNYLISCHYTDIQIGNYLSSLKEKGLYDQSLIVIVADHDAHPKFLNMEGLVSPELPLYIINGGINNTNAWLGECNQLDIYTTLLDIMGIECEWRGLGHSLLTKDYKNSVTDKTWKLSEWIINGNFFSKRKSLKN